MGRIREDELTIPQRLAELFQEYVGQLLSHNLLWLYCWEQGEYFDGCANTLMVSIHSARALLKGRITNIKGRGYIYHPRP